MRTLQSAVLIRLTPGMRSRAMSGCGLRLRGHLAWWSARSANFGACCAGTVIPRRDAFPATGVTPDVLSWNRGYVRQQFCTPQVGCCALPPAAKTCPRERERERERERKRQQQLQQQIQRVEV